MTRRNRFEHAETAEDIANALDFTGAYLSPVDRKDFIDAVRELLIKKWEEGYDSGYEDGKYLEFED